jgi:hypothetical protein
MDRTRKKRAGQENYFCRGPEPLRDDDALQKL